MQKTRLGGLRRRTFLAAGAAGAALTVAAPWVRRAGAADPITIGVVTPLSGPQEFIGIFVKEGAETAVDLVNAGGGVGGRPLRLEFRDDKANPAAATTAARELLGLGINLQMGTISSAVALAMGPLMQAEGGVVLTSGAGTEKLNHENYSPNVFRPGDSPYSRNRALAALAAQRYAEIDEWTGIVPDHEYGRTTWAVFVDGLLQFYPEIAGKQPKILDPIIVPYGVGDYKSFIAQAMRTPARGIYNSTYGGDSITFFQQARPFGLFKDRVLIDSANEFIVAMALKSQTPPHWTGSHWYYAANEDIPLSQAFYKAYVARTGKTLPMGWAGEAQAAIAAYSAAIQKAGGSTETAAVIEGLKGLTFETVTGPRLLRAEDNQAVKDVEMLHIEPDDSAASGFKVADYVKVEGKSVVEPPEPGKAMTLRKPT